MCSMSSPEHDAPASVGSSVRGVPLRGDPVRGDPLRDDFRNFLFLVWHHLGLPPPTPVQYDIARYLQHGPRRSIIMAFRGVGKSFVTSAYACWLLFRDPDHKIMVVSASENRANNFSLFVKKLIEEMPLLRFLRPMPGQRTSLESFDVGPAKIDQTPSVRSIGITGQMTGGRADTIIADDIEIPNNSDTVGKREKLAEAVKEFDAILKPGGSVKYLGTAQTQESIYTTKLEPRGYEIRIWPARYPHPDKLEKYGNRLAPWIVQRLSEGAVPGSPVEPTRFGEQELIERELSYGRAGFALQFMLDTELSDAERYPLKLRDLIVMPLDNEQAPVSLAWGASPSLAIADAPLPGFSGDRYYRPFYVSDSWAPYQGCVMFIDPAGRGKDELAWAVVAKLHAKLFLKDARGMTGGYSPENLEAIAKHAKRLGVKLIRVESNFGDGMFKALLEPVLARIYPCTVEEVRSSRQKELRIIDTLEPVLNTHRLVVDEALIRRDAENYNGHPVESAHSFSLFWQLTHITRDKGSLPHDDRLDALAGAVAYWVEQIEADDDKAEENRRLEKLQEELDRMLEEGPIGQTQKPLWNQPLRHL